MLVSSFKALYGNCNSTIHFALRRNSYQNFVAETEKIILRSKSFMNIPKINKRNVDKMNREQILQTQCNAILLLYAKYAKKKFIMNSYKFEDLSDQYYNDNIANFSYSDETIDHNCKNSPI